MIVRTTWRWHTRRLTVPCPALLPLVPSREPFSLCYSTRANKDAPAKTEEKMRVLCVAEKPSISKAVAGHLSGGTIEMVSRVSTPKGRGHGC